MCNRFEGGGARRKLRLAAYSLLAVLLSIPVGLHAQQYSGSITGAVTDSTGAAIPGATITITNVGTGAKVTQKSGGDGGFTFAQLPVGTYEVTVTQTNFKEFTETGVLVHTSTPTEVPVVMQVGHSAERMPSEMGRPIHVDDIALDFPDLTIVGAHTGWPWVEEMIALAWKHRNVYIGTSAHHPKYLDRSLVAFANSRGKGKVMWGTDYPVMDYRDALTAIDGLGLKDDAKALFVGDAARSVFKLA